MIKLLNEYYKARKRLEISLEEYNKNKEICRKFLKYENHTKEYKKENTLYEIPLTMMKTSELRKKYEKRCKIWKGMIKQDQKKFDEILNKLK